MKLRLISSLAVSLFGAVAPAQQITPLDVRVSVPPMPARIDGHTVLVYELHVTNLTRRAFALDGVDVRADSARGGIVRVLRGSELATATSLVGAPDTAISSPRLPSGRQMVVFVWVDLNQSSPPGQLVHQILLRPADSLSARQDTVGPVVVTLESGKPPVLRSPLGDGLWLARNGPSNTADHRRTLVSVGGVSRIAQRLATDWIRLGPDNRLWKGDSTVNRNWYGYGTPIYAVSDGVIVGAKDSIRENVPLSPIRAVPITLETVAGNHLIERIDGDALALYAHLRPGTLRVRVGQRVRAGQQIGELGNSGNSGAPHLHFHMMTAGASPLGGEGIPFEFARYTSYGRLESLDELFGDTPWQPTSRTDRKRDLPGENAVVSFR